jgi:hypothetical protein
VNSISNDLLPIRVEQSHASFTLLSVKGLMLFQHCKQAVQVLFMAGYRQETLLRKPESQAMFLCP